jgi:hypothetical protein
VVFQFLTGAFHLLSFVIPPDVANETERQIHGLMTTYKIDLGGGFHRTWSDLFTALSSCFTFVCFLGGAVNTYLLRKTAPSEIVRGVTLINLALFGAIFAVLAVFTFLIPIICTALIFLALIPAYLLNRSSSQLA